MGLELTVLLKEIRGQLRECSFGIGTKPLGGLIGNFHTVLQDCYREDLCGHGAQEQPEILVHFIRFLRNIFYQFLHCQHP